MAVKCTECGASIQDDSKFCRYCGAKIVKEEFKHVEIKIDNTAEIKRADYEEQESLIRQKKMKREMRAKRIKLIICGILFFGGIAMPFTNWFKPLISMYGVLVACGAFGVVVAEWLFSLGKK